MGHSLPSYAKMRSFAAILLAACFVAQTLASPLLPAYLNAETGEVMVRVGRQLEAGQQPIDLVDQEVAADSSYAAPHVPLGRMKIQVYRGPNVGYKDAYGHEGYFAPWGYYNTQPLDLSAYH